MASRAPVHLEVADFVGDFIYDPAGFVRSCYPWRKPGTFLADQDGPDVWQEAALEAIGRESRRNAFDGVKAVSPLRRAFSSGHGVGKALSKRTRLHTPDGLREWGDIKDGDLVFAQDGSPTEVVGVFDQGERPMYRVTFDDGASVEADADHLWVVKGRSERRRGVDSWRVMTTEGLLFSGVRRPNGASAARQWQIPAQGAAQFPAQSVSIPPYVLGAWLGDGGRNSSVITSADPEVVERMRALGEKVTEAQPYIRRVSMLLPRLRALGISAAYSYEKRVPAAYLHNDSGSRAEVLRGLLDTDGECGAQGSVTFSSCSRQLAEDVVWLARSLGGKARIQATVKAPTYRDREGVKLNGRPCWRATVTMPAGFRCFYITRKQARLRPVQERYLARWIDRIEPIGSLPAQCITVAHPSECFLANDFVVTHNSTLCAWLVGWIMSTRPHAQGTVTANTMTQLETKTWASIKRWMNVCLTAEWFHVGDKKLYHVDHKDSWFCAPQSSKEENSEAFAGQHAAGSTSFYVFDEDSAIPDEIHRVAEGGLTDGEPMIFLFGNPTRNSGHFHRACFGAELERWSPVLIDSRTSRFTNQDTIAEWAKTYGEDSDFFRVRVLGLPPRASELQFIDQDRVEQAQKRELPSAFGDEPLICGVDVSDGGSAWNVIRFRRGNDARTIPPVRIPGEKVRGDRGPFLAKLAEVLDATFKDRKPDAMFIDSAFGAPYVERLQAMGYKQVHEVRFGSESLDGHQANRRAYMWAQMKEWLGQSGCIDSKDAVLVRDLTAPGYHINKQDKLVLESKEDMMKRGEVSPDDADALCLTFAAPVKKPQRPAVSVPVSNSWGWS